MFKLCFSVLGLFIVQATILVAGFMALSELLLRVCRNLFTGMCTILNSMAVALFYCRINLVFIFIVFANRLNFRPTLWSQLCKRVPLYLVPTCFQFLALSLLEILVNIIWLVFVGLLYVFDVISRWVLGYIHKFWI